MLSKVKLAEASVLVSATSILDTIRTRFTDVLDGNAAFTEIEGISPNIGIGIYPVDTGSAFHLLLLVITSF